MSYTFLLQEFDQIDFMKGVVNYINDIVGDDLAEVSDGVPACLVGYQGNVTPEYPRITVLYTSDTDVTSKQLASGLTEIDDPDNEGETLWVPYQSTYVTGMLSIVVDSGEMRTVVSGSRKSSNQLARTIRKSFALDTNRELFSEYTNSVARNIGTISAQFSTESEVNTYDSSVMTLYFDVIDTEIQSDNTTGWFDTIYTEGQLYHIDNTDKDPLLLRKSKILTVGGDYFVDTEFVQYLQSTEDLEVGDAIRITKRNGLTCTYQVYDTSTETITYDGITFDTEVIHSLDSPLLFVYNGSYWEVSNDQ